MDNPALLRAPRAKLEDQISLTADERHFFSQHSGIHCMEWQAQGTQSLRPAIWKGTGDIESYRSRTQRVPATRLYSFCDEPIAIGRTAIFNAGQYSELDYPSFTESSRFREGRNRELIEEWQHDRIALRVPKETITLSGDCALITQQADHVWGHWLVDVLPRLEIVRRLIPDVTFAFSNMLACSGELLERTGFRPNQMIFYDPYRTVLRAERFFVPGYVRFANAFARVSGSIFNSMSANERVRSNRIYVSRSRLREGSTIVNHQQIEAMFVQSGFQVVHPQTMSIDAQIEMFAQASHIAGEYGSGLHASIFSAPGTPVLCLQSQNMKQYVQAGIGEAMQQPTGFVFGEFRLDPNPKQKKAPSYLDRYCFIEPTLAEAALVELLGL